MIKLAIYEYWNNRNKSTAYTLKLEKLLNHTANLLCQYPTLGTRTIYKDVRVKIIRDYKLFYKISHGFIVILTVWDSRQNPETLNIE
jgi:toxin YoeB